MPLSDAAIRNAKVGSGADEVVGWWWPLPVAQSGRFTLVEV
jgi:hypothetical protein